MFVGVARVTLDIPESGSLKTKRAVVRRVADRLKAKFNAAVAEVDENEVWNRAVLGVSVLGNERRFVSDQLEKILQSVEDQYAAPVIGRETEVVSFADFFSPDADDLTIPHGERSLAEAEGMGAWEERHKSGSAGLHPAVKVPAAATTSGTGKSKKLSLEEARAKARALRNPREWEKK